ncbi:MAG: GIY-YIG nuclease family protein [Bacteroidetes bacterium]|nr:GIY-YIG nuclease family protein [Bacteroidota bacterium]
MEYVTYVLYSYSNKRFYIGFSANSIQRIYWHNNSKKGFTTRFRPWKMIHIEFFETKQEAMNREKILKSGKGREWINQHFNPETGFISA